MSDTDGAMLNYRSTWRFSRGAGQKVALIDAGVNRHPTTCLRQGRRQPRMLARSTTLCCDR
ncbi:hypothetical protein BST30_00950 [Mycobacterium mantenii]|uniref:Uncharacterized protein n=1 Tax=Mycobacterium mantenii TaxID=560555 RepID=A0A1X0G5A3_MYCNT|nr:hypothetical protein BST30_00950 [Mycobacterium mantenii]